MYSYEEHILAVQIYIELGKRTAATIRSLGYPTKNALKSWYREYERSLDLPKDSVRSRSKYTDEQKKTAVDRPRVGGFGERFVEAAVVAGWEGEAVKNLLSGILVGST